MNNHPPLTIHASLALSLAVAVSAGLVNAAQSQARRSFETASIKVSKVSTLGRRPSVISHPPTLTAKNASLQDLIQMAYQVRDFQVSGGPAWIGSDQYDVNAKAVGNPTWAQTMGPMLQALLHDRFKLKLHRETKELPVYVLTVAKGGLKMQRSKEGNCTAFNWVRISPPPGQSPFVHCGVVELTNIELNQTLDAFGMSLTGPSFNAPGLTNFLSRELDRTVIDKTGLTGLFDFHLEWNRQSTANPSSADEFTNPSLSTAVKEQLGLKLESAKGPVEVLIIDHAEKPSEN